MDTKQEADMGVTKESFGFLEDKREAFWCKYCFSPCKKQGGKHQRCSPWI